MKNRKGNLIGVVPMLILLITSSLFSVQSINIANAMADEVIESVENLGKVVEGGSSSGRYFYDHLTKAAAYSINQKSYDLGQEGGGVEWSAQELSLLTTTQVILHERANNYFSENYIQQGLPSQNCQIGDDQEFNILLPNPNNQVGRERQHISGSVVSSLSEIKTNCQFENSRLQQQATQGFYRARYNASYNRYFQLANETTAFYKDLKSEWEDTPVEYTASSTVCGEYPGEEVVEEAAVQKAEAEFENRLDDVADEYPTIDGADLEAEVTDIDYEVTDTSQSTGAGCDCEQVCSSDDDGSDSGDGSNTEQYNDELGGDPVEDGDEDVGTGDTSSSTGFFFSSELSLMDRTADLLDIKFKDSESFDFGNKIQAAYLMRVQDEITDGGGGTPDSDSGDEGSDDSSDDDGDSCPTVCDKTDHTTSVTIEVNEVSAESTFTDTKYNILLDSGWENLEFHVEDYTQEVDSSGEGLLSGFDIGTELLGQASQVYQDLVNPDSVDEDLQSWTSQRQVYEDTRFDVDVDQEEEDAQGNKFQIKLGEKRNLPGSTDSIYFFDRQKGFFNNLYFRANSGTSSTLENCDGSVISGRPLSSFSTTFSKCSYSGVGSFSSGDKTVGICDYEESSETAYLAVFESEASASEINNACPSGGF